MSYFQTENLRTLALVGHGSCGKTTLIEAMLYRSGMIPEPGTVERGNTMCDNDALEKEVGHSIRLAVAHIDTAMPNLTPVRIHVLDTPGYPDYIGQDLSALDAVKSVAAVIDATKGVDLFTQRMMDMAAERKLCRMIVVNKFDVPEANLEELLAEMQAIWGPGVLPINLPTQNHAHVIDCFEREEGESDIMSVADVHRAFIERIVEEDDEQLERYLEQGSVDPRTLHPLITKALREGHIIPVCFVSAKNLIGIRDFMKVIIRHLPSPAEANEALFVRGDGEPFATKPDKDAPVIAQVFKIVNDPYIGKIGVFRVHQGQITKDSVLYVDDNKKPIKIAHPLILQGKNTAETDVLTSGDIGAAAKIDELRYGSVLHSDPEHSDVRMRPIRFPKPMFGLAIRPARRGDESRLSDALNKMLAEDPTMEVDHDVVLNETVIRGITEMHVRSILERMKLHFKVEVETTAPSIPYRETISQPAEGHARLLMHSGGAGLVGEVYLRVEPLDRGKGFEFVDAIKGGVVPREYIPAVQKGVEDTLKAGVLAGYPVVDVKVTLHFGSYHDVDSNENAFKMAASMAFKEGMRRANPVLLEPIMAVEVETPEEKMGDVMGDLSSRRGVIQGMDDLVGGGKSIKAEVPLAEMFGYATQLRSLTQGRATYTMEFKHYAEAPRNVAEAVIADKAK